MDLDFESVKDFLLSHSHEVVWATVGFVVMLWVVMAFLNRESRAKTRLDALGDAPLPKARPARGKGHAGPRFFQEHKIVDSSLNEPEVVPLILVVDDSKTALLAATQALKDAPYRIETAIDGRVAWQKMTNERPALVITDLEMPEVNGMELLRRMRADLRFLDVPVVIVTAHPFDAINQGRASGVSSFLSKPYKPTDLRAQVAHIMREPLPPAPQVQTA